MTIELGEFFLDANLVDDIFTRNEKGAFREDSTSLDNAQAFALFTQLNFHFRDCFSYLETSKTGRCWLTKTNVGESVILEGGKPGSNRF
jgi:hypothetical protein